MPGEHKNASRLVGILLKKGLLRFQKINEVLPRRVRAWETPPLRGSRMPVLAPPTWMPTSRNPCQTASTDCYRNQDISDQIRVPTNTADRSVSQPSKAQKLCIRTSFFTFHMGVDKISIVWMTRNVKTYQDMKYGKKK